MAQGRGSQSSHPTGLWKVSSSPVCGEAAWPSPQAPGQLPAGRNGDHVITSGGESQDPGCGSRWLFAMSILIMNSGTVAAGRARGPAPLGQASAKGPPVSGSQHVMLGPPGSMSLNGGEIPFLR